MLFTVKIKYVFYCPIELIKYLELRIDQVPCKPVKRLPGTSLRENITVHAYFWIK
jgi:hypothetical protein